MVMVGMPIAATPAPRGLSQVASVAPSCNARGVSKPRRYEAHCELPAPPDAVFARLDDQERLAGHMTKASAMMGGGRMTYVFDHGRGREAGSHITMRGSAFGLTLFVDEVVTKRDPPHHKAWETVAAPRLLIMGSYAMGFDIVGTPTGSALGVWIDYSLPDSWIGRALGLLLAPLYARWCVGRMVADAKAAFAKPRAN